MTEIFERRACGELEVRDIDGAPRIVGYAAVFNSLSQEMEGRYREMIVPGAFRDALSKADDIVALVEHAPPPLGRRSAGTLQIVEDDRGLQVAISPPDTQDGRDVLTRIRRGDYNGMSFRFSVAKNGQTWRQDGAQKIREIRAVDRLPEISIVTFPAYLDTSVALRSLNEFERSEIQDWADLQRKKIDIAESAM